MLPVEPPVKQALIFICEKCGKKLAQETNPSVSIQQDLKQKLREKFPAKEMKASLVSCLGICPVEQVSVAIVPNQSQPKYFTVSKDKLDNASEIIMHEVEAIK
ncbi:MAG: hypothetical protein J0H68_01780 [Sphingobacteriia bacterium]|nr:hypothetical protein [Sphingobacteriia bacterium]